MISLSRIIKATKYSIAGFKTAFKSEQAFRDDLIVFFIAMSISFKFSNNSFEIFLSFFSVILLLVAELLNTGLEFLADRISKDYCEYCKNAKDVGSTAVGLVLVFITIYHVYLIIN